MKIELKQTTEVLEDNKKSSPTMDRGEFGGEFWRVSLQEEVGHWQEEVRTFERKMGSIVREESTLKREIIQEMVISKEEDEDSTWYKEDQQVKPLEDIQQACTEREAEKLEYTESQDEEAAEKREEMSLRLVSPPLKEAIQEVTPPVTPPSEMTPTKKDTSGLTIKKDVRAYKKTTQERKFKKADIPPTYAEQKEEEERRTESFASVYQDETVYPMDDLVKPQISDTSKEITLPKQFPTVPKEITHMKQAESAKVEEALSERSMPWRETVSPPPDQDLPQSLPETIISHATTTVSPKKEVETARQEIPKSARKMYPKDIVPLEKPTVSEEMSFGEQLVPAVVSPPVPAQLPSPDQDLPQNLPKTIPPDTVTVVPPKQQVMTPKKINSARAEILKAKVSFEEELIPATVSPPATAQIPSPKKVFCLEEDISPPKPIALPPKMTSPAEFIPEDVSLPKKPVTKDKVPLTKQSEVPVVKKPHPPEEETLQSKTPAVLTQKIITPKVDSSEEERTKTTKPGTTREYNKKAKKGTQEIEQQTLQTGILSHLSCTGS